MSLRSDTMSEYFNLVCQFFHEHKWIYNFKATEILSDDVMQDIPVEFQAFFNSLHDEDQQFIDLLNLQSKDDWPNCVKKFVSDCQLIKDLSNELKQSHSDELNFTLEMSKDKLQQPVKLPKKWNLKKFHEVGHVGNFIGNVAINAHCDVAVDIGSGLGYLSNHLASKYELPVIGVECDSSKVETAQRIVDSMSGTSTTPSKQARQKFISLRITEDITEQLEPLAGNFNKVCLTALHACGDLTPWALKHFVAEDSCKVVAVVPCCYHKMNILNKSNFPMSKSLNSALSTYSDDSFLRNPWLWRLGSQRSGSRFLNDIQRETQNLFFRAVLERFLIQENIQLQKQKRNAYERGYTTFDQYLERTVSNSGAFKLIQNDTEVTGSDLDSIICRIKLLHQELVSWSCTITGMLALQGAIQIIAEEMILLDRIRFLEESDMVKTTGLIRVIPENVSPRGMVLYGIKN